jgi:hypothetical protein
MGFVMTFEDWYKDKEDEIVNLCWEGGGTICPDDFKEYMREAWDAVYYTLTYHDL